MTEMETVIENLYKSWAIDIGERTQEGVEIQPTLEDVERLVYVIIHTIDCDLCRQVAETEPSQIVFNTAVSAQHNGERQ